MSDLIPLFLLYLALIVCPLERTLHRGGNLIFLILPDDTKTPQYA